MTDREMIQKLRDVIYDAWCRETGYYLDLHNAWAAADRHLGEVNHRDNIDVDGNGSCGCIYKNLGKLSELP